ncbi:MBL fold metallo-hydrolase [Shouchella shacheensis]|uniref:MBL fold metallo-hydrolase n=1 Tax=Shouchella shacheensis TaxID=1649580 RepID=UPI000740124B|nr:MBL fold metallo-hydrolase [Shouchella shacheensis]
MLAFIGNGSAFNTKRGNNGAFMKEDTQLFLIDCGSSTFHRLVEKGVLEGVEEVTVLITHLHPDHVGSLGDLIFYSYFKLQPAFTSKVNVMAPAAIMDDLRSLLKAVGVTEEQHTLTTIEGEAREVSLCGVKKVEPVNVEHARELDCFGYILQLERERIYYSGDANMIPTAVLTQLERGELQAVYQDCCKADYEGNVHLSLRALDELIEPNHRKRVWCMHLDEGFSIEEAKELGFQVVEAI